MVKDRLSEFQKKAAVSSSNRSRTSTEDTITIRLDNGMPAANGHLLEQRDWEDMDSFLKNVEVVRAKISEMSHLLRRLRDIHKNILITPGADPALTDELNEIVAKFKTNSQSVSNFVHGINEEIKRINDQNKRFGKTNDAVSRIKTDQARTITRTFQNVLVDFNTEQVSYKEKCEKKISDYLKIAGLHMDDDDVEKAIEKGNLFDTASIMLAERDKKQLYDDVKCRHDDILKLEASIRELHEIFQDMAMLVESQGEIVDRIETNVSFAAECAEKALNNVNQAKRAKNRNIKAYLHILKRIIKLHF